MSSSVSQEVSHIVHHSVDSNCAFLRCLVVPYSRGSGTGRQVRGGFGIVSVGPWSDYVCKVLSKEGQEDLEFIVSRVVTVNRRNTLMVMAWIALWTSAASSCPVCYGADGTQNMSAVNASIIVLLLITGAVLSMFGTFIFKLRRRMKLADENTSDQK